MFKKLLSLILTLLLVLSFAGCKEEPVTEKGTNSEIHKEQEEVIDDIDWKEEDYSLIKLDNKVFKSENKNRE